MALTAGGDVIQVHDDYSPKAFFLSWSVSFLQGQCRPRIKLEPQIKRGTAAGRKASASALDEWSGQPSHCP